MNGYIVKGMIIISNKGVLLDDEGIKFLKEEFYPKDFKISVEQTGKDLSREMNHGLLVCPKCKSKNTNEYIDCFVCFDCKFKKQYTLISEKFDLTYKNGYLVRKNKNTGEMDFFHRMFMKQELDVFSKKHSFGFAEVHHKNGLKTDNRKSNLEVLDEISHRNLHESRTKTKAFETWCEKVHGYIDYDYWYDFEEWIEEKEDGGYERW